MLDYAAKLTLTPAAVTREDVQALRDAGFDDRAVLDIAQITAYFAFVNRTVDGLGVSVEDFWKQPIWTTSPIEPCESLKPSQGSVRESDA
jgi:uncharacterized protein YciW